MLCENRLHVIQGVFIEEDLGSRGLLVVKDWNRNPPRALTGDAPVSTGDYERIDAIFPNLRDPLNLTRSRCTLTSVDADLLQTIEVK